MRVLHLLGATEDIGGILSVIRNLQTATADLGVEHVVWVNQAYREVRRPALTYRFSCHLLGESANHFQLLWRSVRAIGELKAQLAVEPFDVLQAHSRGALFLTAGVAVLWHRPILYTNHAYARRLGPYRWAARRRHMRTSLLTPNMARHYGLSPEADRVAIISECCADGFFSAPLVSRRERKAGAPLRLVGLGNIYHTKKWHLLVEAIAQLDEAERRQIEFHHWGPVPEAPGCAAYDRQLRGLIQSGGVTGCCRLHGATLSAEETLREADWFVLPSTNEPCSVALIEALALGVPALVSASGGNVDIVQSGRTGRLFAPDDVTSLRDTLRLVLRDEKPMATPAEIRESVRARSAKAVADQYCRLYEELSPLTRAV
jgi:glycosyltransferase involved in cell wall biosynthesis